MTSNGEQYFLRIIWKSDPDGHTYSTRPIGPYATRTAMTQAKKELRETAKASGREYKKIEDECTVPHRTAMAWMSDPD